MSRRFSIDAMRGIDERWPAQGTATTLLPKSHPEAIIYSEKSRQNRVIDFAHSTNQKTLKLRRRYEKIARKRPFQPHRIAITMVSHCDSYGFATRSLCYDDAIAMVSRLDSYGFATQ